MTQVTFRPAFQPFTTDRKFSVRVPAYTLEYMFPEPESRCLPELEQFQVDNLIFDVSEREL